MPTRRAKKVLLSLLVLGAVTSITVPGTYAVFNGESQNRSAQISTGTLTLSNTLGANAACVSYGPGHTDNLTGNCTPLATTSTLYYPDSAPIQAQIKIKDDGSLSPSDLAAYMPACDQAATPGAPANPSATDPCGPGGVQFYLQETDSSFAATKCWYPTVAAGSCPWQVDTLYWFAATYSTAAVPLHLGATPTAGNTRYFVVGMRLPPDASNALQGQTAAFTLAWRFSS